MSLGITNCGEARRRKRLAALALGVIAGSSWSLPVAARSAIITVGEPSGFDQLAAAQTLLVDVYFGGVRRGETTVVASPEQVTVKDPAKVVELLPLVIDRGAVTTALSGRSLDANSDRACSQTSDKSVCGRLSPDIVGVILDRSKLRLDVFLNPRLLAVEEEGGEAYLPAPAAGISMVNAIGAVVSGRISRGKSQYTIQDQLMLAAGSRRLRADLSYSKDFGPEADRVALEWDQQDLRYSAGALWAPGNDVTGRRKLVGIGVESQIDTRLDKDQLLGSPVVIYLDQRSRVDVLREGKVLSSAIYEAGNQQIDTSSLPEGSYEIELLVNGSGQQQRVERRFFSKSRQIPSLGRTDFFGFAGMMVNSREPASLKISRNPYAEVGWARRLGRHWAFEANIEATDGAEFGELGATFLTPLLQVRAAAVADLRGRYGGILQVTSAGSSRLNFNLDFRRIEAQSTSDSALAPTAPRPAAEEDVASADWGHSSTSYSQMSGVISYGIANIRFLGVISYRKQGQLERSLYSVGPSLEWDMLRKGPFTLTWRAAAVATDRGTSGFAGLSLRLIGQRLSLSASAGSRYGDRSIEEAGNGVLASLAGSLAKDVGGGELAVAAGYEHQPNRNDAVISSELRHPLGYVSANFVHTDHATEGASQYTFGGRTVISLGGGAVRLAGKATTESMIVARVDGARDGDRFELLINEQVAGVIVGSKSLALPLPTYRAYTVRIRPIGEHLVSYDSASRRVALYPGGVTPIVWKAAPMTIKVGRLVASDGAPLAHAMINGPGVWSETDEQGYFQLEAPSGETLSVTKGDGESFALKVPHGRAEDGIDRIGTITCCDASLALEGALLQ